LTFELIGEIEAVETMATGTSVMVRSQDQELLGLAMRRVTKQFALCLNNSGNEASLVLGKVYRIIPDARAAKDDLVRIIDECGEDYLFSRSQFAFVEFPQAVRKKILALQRAS